MEPPLKIVCKTLQGLEPALKQELEALGYPIEESFPRGFQISGDWTTVYNCNLKLRTALRVLIELGSGPCHNKEALYETTANFAWENWIEPDQRIAVAALGQNKELNNSMFTAQKVKDAVVDRFRDRTGERPSVDRKNPHLPIQVFVSDEIGTWYVDTSGDALFKRGYRQETGEAPINECLAAGIILLSYWDFSSI